MCEGGVEFWHVRCQHSNAWWGRMASEAQMALDHFHLHVGRGLSHAPPHQLEYGVNYIRGLVSRLLTRASCNVNIFNGNRTRRLTPVAELVGLPEKGEEDWPVVCSKESLITTVSHRAHFDAQFWMRGVATARFDAVLMGPPVQVSVQSASSGPQPAQELPEIRHFVSMFPWGRHRSCWTRVVRIATAKDSTTVRPTPMPLAR